MILLEPSPARDFLSGLGQRFGQPRAIVVVSAHHDTADSVVTAVAAPTTIHDFGGFPQALFDLRYPARGHPALADDIARRIADAGFPVTVDPARGWIMARGCR
ncbi:dioxygenase family protein [Sphingomonas sp. RS2018]